MVDRRPIRRRPEEENPETEAGRGEDLHDAPAYGDQRDEAFEAGVTSEPGSMSPRDAAPHPADRDERQTGQQGNEPVERDDDLTRQST